MATLAEMRTAVKSEGGFDVDDPVVDRWLMHHYRRLVVEARWLLEELALATTVAGTAEYAIASEASVVDIEGLMVGGVPYDRGNWRDIWRLKAGTMVLDDSPGLFAGDYSSTGTKRIELYPAPGATGSAIVALAAMRPADLADSASPNVPEEYHPAIEAGAIAMGLRRIDERGADLAPPYEKEFETAIVKLTRLGKRRIGNGPARMRVGR